MPQFSHYILQSSRPGATAICRRFAASLHALRIGNSLPPRRHPTARRCTAHCSLRWAANWPVGLTLLELLLVIAILGLVVGLSLPSSEPGIHEQLRAAARVLATDLDYARALAVANSSSYSVTFDIPNNRYTLRHSGSNPSLDKLPRSPFSAAVASNDAYVVDLKQLPVLGANVRLSAVLAGSNLWQATDRVEFGPLGETTNASPVTIWLAAGSGRATRYIPVAVNPATGLVTVGQYSGIAPTVEVQPGGG